MHHYEGGELTKREQTAAYGIHEIPYGVEHTFDLVDTFLNHNERHDEKQRQWQEGPATYLEKMMSKGELEMHNASSPFKF